MNDEDEEAHCADGKRANETPSTIKSYRDEDDDEEHNSTFDHGDEPAEESKTSKKKSGRKSGKAGGSGGSSSAPTNPAIKPRCNCETLNQVDCHLETKELWDKFNELGTEMIITKTGR